MRKISNKPALCWLIVGLTGLLLVGCDSVSAEEETPAATPTAAPVVIVVPTVTPEPTKAPLAVVTATVATVDTPTPAPTLAEPVAAVITPTLAPVAVAQPVTQPTVERVALVRYRDNQYARSGDFTILSTDLPAPPAGHHYDLWLVKDGQPTFRLGNVPNQIPLNHTGSADQHLLAIYEGALLSLEPDANTPGEMGPILFQGATPPQALVHIRQIADRFAANPAEQGFLIGALDQWQLAREHTDFMREAIANDNLGETRRHAEHVINIINGEQGSLFGDLDGDGAAQNPGDNVGVVGYLSGTQEQATLAASTGDATAEIKLHAGHVLVSSDNVRGWLEDGVAEVLRVLAADSAGEAQPTAEKVAALLDQAYAGIDPDGDGVVMPLVGQGGLLTAYEHTLNMGGIEIYPVNQGGAETEIAALAPAQAAPAGAHDHGAAPTALPTEAAPAPAPTPAPVVIEMSDFAFSAPSVTVPAGTTVTWINRGGAKHSATADDGSFDTGLLNPGANGSVTFAQPGTYRYYCMLHGGSGGLGMAGTIIVAGQ